MDSNKDFKFDISVDASAKETTIFNWLGPWFGCFCYLLVGLTVSLVYVLSEVDYLMLSGVFRAQRFFSDDPFYFSKQILVAYGFVGFLVTIVVGPIGRLTCVLWSWALSCAYFCLSFYVFLYRFSQYGRFMMLALCLLSLLSHVLLANFVFFLFDPTVPHSDFRLHRCFAFLIGFFVGSPFVSFVLFRLKLCFTTSMSYDFRLKTFDIFRMLFTLFSIAMLSSLCLTYEFFYNGGDSRVEWAPAKLVRAPVRTIAQFVDGEVVVLIWLISPMWVDLGQYAASNHGDWVEARLGHKAMFAVALIALLFWTFASAWQLCFKTINEINAAIFNVMFTDGYAQLKDDHMKERPVSVSAISNYKRDFTNGNKTKNTLSIPGPVMYPYLPDTWDDAENEDKLLLMNCLKILNGLDIISQYLSSGSTAELCKLTNDINLQDCWLESQEPLSLIGHILSEYNNNLSVMIGNSLNLNKSANSCSELNPEYFKYLLHSYSHYNKHFSSLFNEEIKKLLKYFKCGYKDDIRYLWFYVCCLIKHLKCFKTPFQRALPLVCDIELKVHQIEAKIENILQELKFSYAIDIVLQRFTKISTAISKLKSLSLKLSFCKNSMFEIKTSLESCNIDLTVSQLLIVKHKLCEFYRNIPESCSYVSNIETIVETLRSVEQFVSPFTQLLVKLETLKDCLEYNLNIGFLVHENVEIKLRLYFRFISRLFSNQKFIAGLNAQIVVCKSSIKQLKSNLCEPPLKVDEICSIFNCIQCYKSKLECNIDKIKTTEHIISKFFYSSTCSTITQLEDLIKRIDPLQPIVSGQKAPDTLNQTLISLRANTNDMIWFVYSHMVIVESKLVVSRLCSAIHELSLIFDNIRCVNYCSCCCDFKSKYGCYGRLDFIYYLSIYRLIDDRHNISSYFEIFNNRDKHLCLCLIINYNLYPKLMMCMYYLLGIDLDISGSMTRKYDKNATRSSQICGISKLLLYAIEVCVKLTNWVRNRYICGCDKSGCCCKRAIKMCNPSCLVCMSGSNFVCNCKQSSQGCSCNCFCRCARDHYYFFFFSITPCISSLLDNIVNMNSIEIERAGQKLSQLILEFCETDCDLIKSMVICGTGLSGNSETLRYINHSIVVVYLIVSKAFLLFDVALRSFSIENGSSDPKYSFSVKEMAVTTIEIPQRSSYQGFFNLTFSLLSENVLLENKTHIATINSTVAQRYLTLCQSNNDFACLKTNKSILCCRCITFARCFINLCGRQLLNTGMTTLASHKYEIEKSNRIANDIVNSGISYNGQLNRLNRNVRIVDVTCSLSNTSQPPVTELNPKYYVSDKVYRPSACFGFGYFKFVITRFFLVVALILMFWFLRFRFNPFVLGGFSQVKTYDYAATSERLNSLITTSQNTANNNSLSCVADTKVATTRPRLKKAKHFVLIAAFASVSALYIALVIRDIHIAVSVDFKTMSYLINVAIVCGMFMTVFIKYFIHLYDFVQVLQRYGVKLTRASTFFDTAASGDSHAVMLLSLVKTMGSDLASLALLKQPRPSASSYNDMKNALYPYNTMSSPVRRMASVGSDRIEELATIRASVLASLGQTKKVNDNNRNDRKGKLAVKSDNTPGKVSNTIDLHNVLDFLSYVLMSKTRVFAHYHTFTPDDAYLAWRLGKPINHNFFLLTYSRYTAIYELYAKIQALNFGQFYTAEHNCNLLWQAFGDAQTDAITMRCMAEDGLATPMTELQTHMLKAKMAEEYQSSFIKFQMFVATTAFGVKDKNKSNVRPTDELFPFVEAFNKQELDRDLVARMALKFFGDTQRKVGASAAVPSSTCNLEGSPERVRDRLKDSCSEWLDKKKHCCESLAGQGCECIVHRAHDMMLKTIAEPGDLRDNIVTLVEGINLEKVEILEHSFDIDAGPKRALKDFAQTMLEHRHVDAVTEGYEATVSHYLNGYLLSSYQNRERAMAPLGLYMQWHGAPLCEEHLKNIEKFDHFI